MTKIVDCAVFFAAAATIVGYKCGKTTRKKIHKELLEP
jgi:hypothetical protein